MSAAVMQPVLDEPAPAQVSRRVETWCAVAGMVAAAVLCLFGSQLILYPVAFAFFVSAGLFGLRPVDPRSTS